jgi:hypothetical protein
MLKDKTGTASTDGAISCAPSAFVAPRVNFRADCSVELDQADV